MEKPSYLMIVVLLLFLKPQAQGLNFSAITYLISKPRLDEISDGHTIVGQKLILKCTFRYRGQFTMDWNVPNETGIQSSKINFGKLTKTNNEDEYFRNLEIENTTIADQGAYTCTVRSSLHVNNVTRMIRIFNCKEHFIHLYEENGYYDVFIRAGAPRVQWRININAHPQPKLTWYDNNDKEILNARIPHDNPKYQVTKWINSGKVFLTINSITMFDRGYYKLKAITAYEEKTIRLFLNVTNDTDGFRKQSPSDKDREIITLINEIKQRMNFTNIKRGPFHDDVARVAKLVNESSDILQLLTRNFSSIPEFPRSDYMYTQQFQPTILKFKPQIESPHEMTGYPKANVLIFIFVLPLLAILLLAYFCLMARFS